MRPTHNVEFKGALATATDQLHWVSLALQQIPTITERHTWSACDARSVSLRNGASWFGRCRGFTFMLCPRPLSSTCRWVRQSAHRHRTPHTTAQSVLSCSCGLVATASRQVKSIQHRHRRGARAPMCLAKDRPRVRRQTTTQTSRQTRGCDLDHVTSPAMRLDTGGTKPRPDRTVDAED